MIGMLLSSTPLRQYWNMRHECVSIGICFSAWHNTSLPIHMSSGKRGKKDRKKSEKNVCIVVDDNIRKQSWKDIDKRQDNPNPLVFLFGIQFYVRRADAETLSACRIPISILSIHSSILNNVNSVVVAERSICAMRPYAMKVAQCWVAINPCIGQWLVYCCVLRCNL